MNKANKQLINLSIKAGNLQNAVYLALRNNVESGNMVYLDNAYGDVSHAMSKHQFAGFLAALTEKGMYRKTSDACFGELILSNNAE